MNNNVFSPKLLCTLILWRSAFGMLIGIFRHFLTELTAHDTIIAGLTVSRFIYYYLLFIRITVYKLIRLRAELALSALVGNYLLGSY